MLCKLSIRNYALIEELEIQFDSSFNVITGETGAGKSILLGALGLLSGNRADKSSVRKDATKCIVEGEFNVQYSRVKYLYEKNDLDSDDVCIVRREVGINGKSRAFINDTPVNINVLKEFGDCLIDIHSQHENLLISDSYFQLNTIDVYSDSIQLLKEYQSQYLKYNSLQKELDQLKDINAKAKADQDYYQFQFNELEEADLKENELNELENELQLIESSEGLAIIAQSANQVLSESEDNIIQQIQVLKNDFSKYSGINEDIDEIHRRLSEIEIELSDLGDSVSDFGNSLSFDEERKQIVSDRLDLINGLLVKHRVNSCSELLKIYNDLSDKLNELDSLDDKILLLEKELKDSETNLLAKGKVLSKNRQDKFKSFEKEVKNILEKIGIPSGELKIAHKETVKPNEYGLDHLSYLFSANKGEDPKEIGKVASGGEISRLMLALKSMIAKKSTLPTVVFDEIDTGISGEVAGKVGDLMRIMSDNLQLMVITHLPQIASKGKVHFKVKKQEDKTKTISTIIRLSNEERIEEVAGMLSGSKISKEALANAKSLLS